MLATALGLAPDALSPAVQEALYVTSLVSAIVGYWYGRLMGRHD